MGVCEWFSGFCCFLCVVVFFSSEVGKHGPGNLVDQDLQDLACNFQVALQLPHTIPSRITLPDV